MHVHAPASRTLCRLHLQPPSPSCAPSLLPCLPQRGIAAARQAGAPGSQAHGDLALGWNQQRSCQQRVLPVSKAIPAKLATLGARLKRGGGPFEARMKAQDQEGRFQRETRGQRVFSSVCPPGPGPLCNLTTARVPSLEAAQGGVQRGRPPQHNGEGRHRVAPRGSKPLCVQAHGHGQAMGSCVPDCLGAGPGGRVLRLHPHVSTASRSLPARARPPAPARGVARPP